MYKVIFFFLFSIVLCSCKKEHKSNDYSPNNHSRVLIGAQNSKTPEQAAQQELPKYLPCKMCNQTGKIPYFDGSIIDCPSCMGQGQISTAYLLQVINQQGGGMSNDQDEATVSSVSYVDNEIEYLEKHLNSLEEIYENCSGEVNQAYLSSQIVTIRSRIETLKRQR